MRVFPLFLLVGGLLAAAATPDFAGGQPTQSPINIVPPANQVKLPELVFDYPRVKLTVKSKLVKDATPINNSQNFRNDPDNNLSPFRDTHPRHAPAHLLPLNETHREIEFTTNKIPTLTIGMDKYKMVAFHFHQRSEHALNGKLFPMEMHMVHQRINKDDPTKLDDKFLAVGRWIQVGQNDNPLLEPVFDQLAPPGPLPPPPPGDYPPNFAINNFNLSRLLPGPNHRRSYRYEGSLTTGPPVSPTAVSWIVLSQPLRLSEAQINVFRANASRGTVRKLWEPLEQAGDYYHPSHIDLQTNVPEPSTVWLLAIAGLVTVRRRRRSVR